MLQAQRQQYQYVFIMRLRVQVCTTQALRLKRSACLHRGDYQLIRFWGHGIKKGRVITSRGLQG
jgi:hypothetical protein